ncbi:hypothetical protein Bca52824_073259 [Brassica carinata]|uniref:LisH domain-containing protein n=1 Tax=Brassica carinata TaxID=52824 RepID=A0A8X7Q9P2_BRACI|nr:hypothetical protein Bca52824_073259 [Brassica carinata]
MPKTLAASEPSRVTINPALLALKPREVLISRPVMAKESKAVSLKLEQKTLLFRLIAQYLEQRGALPDLEEVYGVFLNKSHLEAVERKYESGDDVEKKAGIVDENASDDHETDKEEENMKEVAEVSVMEGIEKKNKSKSMEAETLGNEDKVSKMRKTSEPEETKEHTDDDEESKHRKKEEDVAEDDMNVQEILVKQTADVQENGVSDMRRLRRKDEATEEERYIFSHIRHLEAVEGKYESGDDVEKKAGIVDENASDDHETDKEEENMKEVAEVSVMEGIEKAETLGNEDKVSKMRKTSEPEETKEHTDDDEESKHRKKEEDVAEDDMNVQEILVKQTADVQENGNDGADSGNGAKPQEVVGKVKRKEFPT